LTASRNAYTTVEPLDETRRWAELTRRVVPLDILEPRRRRPARERPFRAGRSVRTLVRLNSSIVYHIPIRQDVKNARWGEFVERYRGMMLAYLSSRFPALEAEDIVQETLMSLSQLMPYYRYDPKATGYFHNYLTGILRNKALRECDRRTKDTHLHEEAARLFAQEKAARDAGFPQWQRSVYEIAMRQLLADKEIHQRSKQIFLRLAVDGRSPESVAEAYGVERNAVDKIKSRMISRLKKIIQGLEDVYGK